MKSWKGKGEECKLPTPPACSAVLSWCKKQSKLWVQLPWNLLSHYTFSSSLCVKYPKDYFISEIVLNLNTLHFFIKEFLLICVSEVNRLSNQLQCFGLSCSLYCFRQIYILMIANCYQKVVVLKKNQCLQWITVLVFSCGLYCDD